MEREKDVPALQHTRDVFGQKRTNGFLFAGRDWVGVDVPPMTNESHTEGGKTTYTEEDWDGVGLGMLGGEEKKRARDSTSRSSLYGMQ